MNSSVKFTGFVGLGVFAAVIAVVWWQVDPEARFGPISALVAMAGSWAIAAFDDIRFIAAGFAGLLIGVVGVMWALKPAVDSIA